MLTNDDDREMIVSVSAENERTMASGPPCYHVPRNEKRGNSRTAVSQ